MRRFDAYNPIVVTACFLMIGGVAMFCMDPALLLISLTGALAYRLLRCGLRGGAEHWFALGLFAVTALINPLVYHDGVTVLFVMNHRPVTLEALLYGMTAALMLVAVLYWFRSFSQIMTGDKLLYVFGALSPKLSLILSMALRYVPLFGRQAKQVRRTQRALGMYKDDNIVDSLRGEMRVFSVMVTWTLENGIITADSMAARGYGTGRRTHYSNYRFAAADIRLLLIASALTALTLWGMQGRAVAFYPAFVFPPVAAQALCGYAAYSVLALLPAIIHAKEALRWHFLRSAM